MRLTRSELHALLGILETTPTLYPSEKPCDTPPIEMVIAFETLEEEEEETVEIPPPPVVEEVPAEKKPVEPPPVKKPQARKKRRSKDDHGIRKAPKRVRFLVQTKACKGWKTVERFKGRDRFKEAQKAADRCGGRVVKVYRCGGQVSTVVFIKRGAFYIPI